MRASQKYAASITVTRSLEIMETNSLYWPLALFFVLPNISACHFWVSSTLFVTFLFLSFVLHFAFPSVLYLCFVRFYVSLILVFFCFALYFCSFLLCRPEKW